MKLFTKLSLEKYSKTDEILKIIDDYEKFTDFKLISHQWLKSSVIKRHIFQEVYAPLFLNKKLKILDVGGGYSSITKYFIENHDYTLLDIMSHDDHSEFKNLSDKLSFRWINDDWHNHKPDENYDLIIANDIFPNVDQRLEGFLKKYTNFSKNLNLSLTYYNNDRFYKVKRVDAEEVLFLKAWNGEMLSNTLSKFTTINENSIFCQKSGESLFNNGRSVVSIQLPGNLI